MIETTLTISGMMCGMCEAHICDTVRQAFDIQKISASHKKGRAVIRSAQPLDEAALRAVIAKTGYEVTSVSVKVIDSTEPRGLKRLFRR